jgi:hypothetical protein
MRCVERINDSQGLDSVLQQQPGPVLLRQGLRVIISLCGMLRKIDWAEDFFNSEHQGLQSLLGGASPRLAGAGWFASPAQKLTRTPRSVPSQQAQI